MNGTGTARRDLARQAVAGPLLAGPGVLGLVVFIAIPFLMAIVLSFTDLRMGSPLSTRFVWLRQKPVFATVTIITFLFFWGFFLWPQMVTSGERVRPLPVAIATFHTLPPLQGGDIFAFGVMMETPVLILFFAFQRWFVRGVATAGTKG